MYTSVRNAPDTGAPVRLSRVGRISRNVVFLGLTSLFTDMSQEMVTAVLPLYLTFELRLTPLQFGLIDGMYHGASALVRLAGGLFSDRRARHKEVAMAGYGVSAATKAGLLVAGQAWLPVTGLLFIDRLGKGMRTSPRDALISLSTDRAALGTAFGVHRALDTAGALLGPLAAFVLLSSLPYAYDAIFVSSLSAAILGFACLALFVTNPRAQVASDRARVSLRRALGLLRERPFRRIVAVGTALSLLTVSDGFIYLVLQRRAEIDPRWFPLLFLGTAAVYLALAVPLGRLADRVGRARVFIGGYLALAAAYALLLLETPSAPVVVAVLALHGAYYAATDGILMAITSAVVDAEIRTSGIALVTTFVSLARFVAAVAFGAAWLVAGITPPVAVFLGALVLALPFAARAMGRVPA